MAGLDVYSATNISVQDAIQSFESGKLTKLAGADVAPHW
jgi:predicted Fe-Mo cluster-binding NifX family protein